MNNFAISTYGVSPQTIRPPTKFAYDAVTSKGKRRQPNGILRSEDAELFPEQRRLLVSGTRDLQRNFVLPGWMMRKHLDYVATFSFQSKIGDKAKDKAVEKFVESWSKPGNCDIAGRHSLQRMIWIAEMSKIRDGDIGCIRLNSKRLQWCEGDRIRTPNIGGDSTKDPGNLDQVIHGVKCNKAGRALSYAINSRGWGPSGLFPGFSDSLLFDRWIAADNLHLHGAYDRFDQVRGISPLAPCVNHYQDIYECSDYALAKMKVHQLFAMIFFRQAFDSVGSTEDDPNDAGYEVDFGKGPIKLELDPGDDAKFLESQTPSTEFQQFMTFMIAMVLKALDIPYSFYDEAHTNYSGARQALLQYVESTKRSRTALKDLLDWIIQWRLTLAIMDGELPGIRIEELAWLWIPSGIPWIDPLKEMEADAGSVENGFNSTPDITMLRTGRDAYEIADAQLAYVKYREQIGLPPLPSSIKPAAAQDNKQPQDQAA